MWQQSRPQKSGSCVDFRTPMAVGCFGVRPVCGACRVIPDKFFIFFSLFLFLDAKFKDTRFQIATSRCRGSFTSITFLCWMILRCVPVYDGSCVVSWGWPEGSRLYRMYRVWCIIYIVPEFSGSLIESLVHLVRGWRVGICPLFKL